MTIRLLLLSTALTFAACGGGSKPQPVEPMPQPTTSPDPVAATTPPEKKEEPPPAPPPPPAPKLVLGEAKLVMKATMKQKGKATETVNAEIALAADGTLNTTVTSTKGKKKDKKATSGKLTVDGELFDDKSEVIATIGADGTVSARQVMEETKDGKVVKAESKMEDVGTISDDGVFTNKKDGKTLSFDDKGKLVGFTPEAQFTLTAAPEQKKAAMFIVIAMFAASKMTTDMSNASASAAVPATPADPKTKTPAKPATPAKKQ